MNPASIYLLKVSNKNTRTNRVGGLKVISRIHVAIVFLETIYHKNKETAKKKFNYCIFHGLPVKIRGNDQI